MLLKYLRLILTAHSARRNAPHYTKYDIYLIFITIENSMGRNPNFKREKRSLWVKIG